MTTPDQLIAKMSELYDLMLDVATELHEREIYVHAAQLAGAAGMLQTWIDGIKGEIEEGKEEP